MFDEPSCRAVPITGLEFQLLFEKSEVPYRTALMIAWHSGQQMKKVIRLTWQDIENKKIKILPELDAYLKTVPHTDSLVCPGMDLNVTEKYLCQLFIDCGIFTRNNLPAEVFGLQFCLVNLINTPGNR